MSEEHSIEPLLTEEKNRYTLFPIKYWDIFNMYKEHEKSIWHADEIDYKSDVHEFEKLSDNERHFIETILAFFAGADGIVIENLMTNFSKEIKIPEATAFYACQTFMEQVHSETYSKLLETYIKDKDKRNKLFNAIEEIPCVKKKAEWALKWLDTKNSFAERLVAFSVVEGVFFSASFCAIFWLKERSIMSSCLGHSNELISIDEALHCNFAILLYKYVVAKLSVERMHEIFREAVEIEKEFITESLPCSLINMNKNLMIQYIKFVANHWLKKYEYPELYPGVSNPFSFMILNNVDIKANFFEVRPGQYQKPMISTSTITIKDDF